MGRTKNTHKYNLDNMDVIEIYKLVLNGSIGKFPNGFWQKPEAPQNAIKCTKFMIENILRWNDEDIKSKLTGKIFAENKLSGMIQSTYDSIQYNLINATYPDKFKPWDLVQVKPGYWNKETAISATKWLLEEKLKLSDEQIKEQFDKGFMEKHKLSSAVDQFGNSPYKLLNATYPNRFKPWDLKQTKNGYWNKETAREALKWTIEEKLKLNYEQIKKIDANFFNENGIRAVLNIFGSIYLSINEIYPNKFKPWDLNSVPQGYWNEKNAIEATKWLLEEKLKWNDQEIKEKLMFKTFEDNGLVSAINIFDNSLFNIVNATYPNRFKSWEFSRVQRNYWKDDNIIKTIKWLIEEKLKWNKEDIKQKFCCQTLIDNGLARILSRTDNLFSIIDMIYPNEFKPWELSSTPQGYWKDKENVKYAIKWLLEEKLKTNDIKNISKNTLIEYGLASISNNYTIKEIKEIYLKK